MEGERQNLQDKVFSEATIRTILAATRYTSQKGYNSRWEGFTSWCSKRGQNPISSSVKHILDFLQLKSETLTVNSLMGYVTAISRSHAMVQGEPFSLAPPFGDGSKVSSTPKAFFE